jgi:hypothetical protein
MLTGILYDISRIAGIKDAIETGAETLNIRPVPVEKDYWVTYVHTYLQ